MVMRRIKAFVVVAFALSSGIVAQVHAVDMPPPPSTAAVSRLRALAAQVYAVSPAPANGGTAKRLDAAETTKAVADMRANLDAVLRGARVAGFADEAAFSRKWRQVTHLVDNLDRARTLPQPMALQSVIPARSPAARRMPVSALGDQGARCGEALGLRAGHEIDVALAGAGQAGSEAWLRILPGEPALLRLGTAASSLDTEITLFADACPHSDSEAVARSDDAFGLAASVAVDTRTQPKVYFARLRNDGPAGTAFVTLDPTATIAGRISDQRNGEPLWADVQTLTADGFWGYTAVTDPDGSYQLQSDAGSFYVFAEVPNGAYVPEFYPDQPCPGSLFTGVQPCIEAGAQAIAVADGATVSGIDIALNIGGRIAGAVRDRVTGAPISGASVWLFHDDGTPIYPNPFSAPATTDAAGRYVFQGLLTDGYLAYAAAAPYGSELWNRIDCAGTLQQSCIPLAGTPIPVMRDELTSDVDFDLPRLASIHAVVASPVLDYTFWSLTIYDASGGFVTSSTSVNGVDAVGGPLMPGSYFAVVSTDGFFPQLWNGIDCTADCATLLGQGTPIAVELGQQAETTFVLHPLPSVSGQVIDATTNEPVADAQVALLDSQTLNNVASTFTGTDGRYDLVSVRPGNYYVWVTSPTHLDAVYPGVPCERYLFPGCDLSAATVVAAPNDGGDLAHIDLALQTNGSINGRVQMRVPPGFPPQPAPYEAISIFDTQGRPVAQATVLPDGSYSATDIPAGTFYALSSGSSFAQVYDGIDCDLTVPCDPTIGTPIVLAQGAQASGIDFDNLPVDVIFGRVTDASGQGIGNVAIDLWASLDLSHEDVGVTDAGGYYIVRNAYSLYYGNTYLLSTDAGGLPYDDQVYDGIVCPMGPAYLGLCSLADATPVGAPAVPGFVLANFSLHTGTGTLFRNGFDP
jgi:protocatechuate 3,4-dioxygenase beta subunit